MRWVITAILIRSWWHASSEHEPSALHDSMKMLIWSWVQALSMILYDYDMLNPDDEIGRCSIPINDLNDQEHYDLWLEVYDPAQEAETRTHQKVGCTAS